MLRVALKGIFAHKLRLALTALAVVLGVAFMAGSLVLTDTIAKVFDDLFAEVNEGTDAVVRKEEAFEGEFGESQRGRVTNELLDQVRAVEGVAGAEGQVQGFAQFTAPDGEPIGNPGQGAPTIGFNWSSVEALTPFTLVEGDPPSGDGEVVMDQTTAEDNDFAVGDTVSITTQAGVDEFEITGIARFGEAGNLAGASVALFETSAAQELVGEPGKFEQIGVTAADGVSQDELVTRLADVIHQPGPGGQPANEDVEVVSGTEFTEESQDDFQEQIGFISTFLLIFAGIALFVGSFIIYNTFSIIVVQRGRELALLRAIGASTRQVRLSVMLESVVVGIFASAVGVVAGIGLASGLKAAFDSVGFDLPAGSTVVAVDTIVASVITGVLVTVVAALFPARKASRIPPLAALRDIAVDTSGRSAARRITGLVILLAGALGVVRGLTQDDAGVVGLGVLGTFVGVAVLGPVLAAPISRVIAWPIPRLKGITGTVARENAVRSPKRTSATASALMIAVTLIGFITIFADSAKASVDSTIDRSFAGDFAVDSQTFGFGGLPPSLAAELNELAEVDSASGLRFGQAQINFGGEVVFGLDPATMFEIVDVGILEGDPAALDEDGIAVHVDQAEELQAASCDPAASPDGGRPLEVGDTLPVRFAATGCRDLRVALIYEHDDALSGTFPVDYLLGLPAYEANFEDQFDQTVYVQLAEGVSQEDGRAAIESVSDEYPLAEVRDQEELKEAQAAQINQLLALIYVLLALAVVIAFIGIINTLGLSIYERTRELGLMRAVGMTRRQLRSSIRWEAVIIALLGTLLGLVLGLLFSWAIIAALESQGFNTFRVPFGQLLFLAVVAAGLGVLMAVFPAIRASRLDVLDAIATE